MNEQIVFTFSVDELADMLITKIEQKGLFSQSVDESNSTLSFNQARKTLGISYEKLKRLIDQGFITTTSDQRRVIKKSINDYLNQKR